MHASVLVQQRVRQISPSPRQVSYTLYRGLPSTILLPSQAVEQAQMQEVAVVAEAVLLPFPFLPFPCFLIP